MSEVSEEQSSGVASEIASLFKAAETQDPSEAPHTRAVALLKLATNITEQSRRTPSIFEQPAAPDQFKSQVTERFGISPEDYDEALGIAKAVVEKEVSSVR